jgi:hypothetical protein
MTKKDYIVIAKTLNKLVKGVEQDFSKHHMGVIRELVNNLSSEFKADNPQFNKKIFWKACGL